MAEKLQFEHASDTLVEVAKSIRGRVLTEFYYMNILDFENINTKHFTKDEIMNYLSYKDDVLYFTQYREASTFEVISNTILNMNRN
ncbi:hypothetical protein PZL33_10345 [Staphylococcus hominis]|uniref:hypothetical protein n=1 Tax=Staphylococcus hominis TaxID=1290 RepID=UPI00247FE239|nr:hypothetical protein [Staphylococcus hominis]MDH9922410.1 hypothetical protein [Staphylococcus hominis]MDH9924581.1 hypothetical protein [Staphylococcus hominis]